jgi:hypothetical protein
MNTFLKYLKDTSKLIEKNYNEDKFEENEDIMESLLIISTIQKKIKDIKKKYKVFQPITCNICNIDKKKNNYYNGGSHGDKTCISCKKINRKLKKKEKKEEKIDEEEEEESQQTKDDMEKWMKKNKPKPETNEEEEEEESQQTKDDMAKWMKKNKPKPETNEEYRRRIVQEDLTILDDDSDSDISDISDSEEYP